MTTCIFYRHVNNDPFDKSGNGDCIDHPIGFSQYLGCSEVIEMGLRYKNRRSPYIREG